MQEVLDSVSAPLGHYELARYGELVESVVTAPRLQHILRVVELTGAIARGNRFSDDERSASLLAALLHDAARDLTAEELFELAPPLNDLERGHPLALHGRAGRRLAERWGVTDQVVLEAIEGHVFGVRPGDRVGMAVYVADVAEPGRGVNDDLRELAARDLEAAYRQAVRRKVEYLKGNGKPIHPATMKVYAEILDS